MEYPQKNINHLLEGRNAGVLSAHNDDPLVVGPLGASSVSELVLSDSRAGIDLGTEPGFVATGRRPEESQRAAPHLGIDICEQAYYPDGELADHVEEIVSTITDFILRREIEVLVTIGGLTDHRDHVVSGYAGRLAAAQVFAEHGKFVDVVELQMDDRGEWRVPATEESSAAVFRAASEYSSQFRVSAQPEGDEWVQVPGGLWVDPSTFDRLIHYPILRDGSAVLFQSPDDRPEYHPETPIPIIGELEGLPAPAMQFPSLVSKPTRQFLDYVGWPAHEVGITEVSHAHSRGEVLCQQWNIPPEAAAKCVVAKTREGEMIALVVPADAKADKDIARRRFGVKLARALPSKDTVEAETGMTSGSITPFGLPDHLPVLIDDRLADQDTIVAGSGLPGSRLIVPRVLFDKLPNKEFVPGLGVR